MIQNKSKEDILRKLVKEFQWKEFVEKSLEKIPNESQEKFLIKYLENFLKKNEKKIRKNL